METKNWWESKIIWSGVIVTLISALELFASWYEKADFSVPSIVTFIVGILIIVVRVWFTSTTIKK